MPDAQLDQIGMADDSACVRQRQGAHQLEQEQIYSAAKVGDSPVGQSMHTDVPDCLCTGAPETLTRASAGCLHTGRGYHGARDDMREIVLFQGAAVKSMLTQKAMF